MTKYKLTHRMKFTFCAAAVVWAGIALQAQTNGPILVDPNLRVRSVVSNLDQPTSMAFLGANDFLVLEKASGRVLRVVDGAVTATALDLAVNSASERGLLGIALHPDFPANPGVYLYWTESSTGADSGELADVPLLGNRVDRFMWNGSTLTREQNLIRLRALQQDADQPLRGNHDGGVVRFGPDGKLYIYMGDNGRRGQMQNLPDGPGPDGNMPDDQFGGPEPDDAHLTGVVLRLNDDGSAPTDNPFFRAGAIRGGEAGANLQKVFAYGIRNGFGMAFDPFSGELWEGQNGDDSFTEINRVEAGANLGWIQVMGPLERIAQFKEIETSSNFFGLQQIRWSPTNIADSAQEALARLFMVFEGGDEFGALMTGAEEVPPVQTDARALARFTLNPDGTLSYELRATGPIEDATQAHIHVGGRKQNGPVVLFLFGFDPAGQDFQAGDLIASGTVNDSDVIERPGFTPTISNLVQRIRQGRTYANLHTIAHPGGEVRGQIIVTDRAPVSRYSDPEFSWKFEVAPAGIGFISSRALGPQYQGDLIVGAARDFLQGGTLFRFNLTGNRRKIAVEDPRLEDRVADNLAKFEITESESLLFGTGFGIGTDIHTGPNGNLYVVSLSNGTVYEISRLTPTGKTGLRK
ncbi:MAG: PQQ-dependent sugar dehydrogenase [Verrucomicrobia subdivision 3 bacterium]|nr:PQQ-dependent sugar dehydrogenase [Limisphaerales bacterium]